MEIITSRDRTRIAYTKSGSGPPLLLIHGTAADHSRWAPVLPALEARYTIYAIDRRGRGGSGDTRPYAIEAEYEDAVAVAESIGDQVTVFGHSYGGLVALGAALQTAAISRLVLYEAPVPARPGSAFTPEHHIAEIERLAEAGDGHGATEVMFRDVVGVPAPQLKALQDSPVWAARVAAAHTLARELRAVETYVLDRNRLANLHIPTGLLLGGASPEVFRAATHAVAAALPHARVVELPGQQHVAMNTDPEGFVAALDGLLRDGAVASGGIEAAS